MEQFSAFSLKDPSGPRFLFDGSMGKYLEVQYNVKRNPTTWILDGILDESNHPSVIKAHQDYIRAGADIITTFNFACTPVFLKTIGKLDEMGKLTEIAGKLARTAVQTYDFKGEEKRKILIAGSLPPPGQCFHECSQFTDEMFDETFKIIIAALNKYVDFYIAETFSATRDVLLTCKAARKYAPEKVLFASFAVDKGLALLNGDSVEKCIEKLEKEMDSSPDGYGVNCSELQYTYKVTYNISMVTTKPLIAYPNDLEERKKQHAPSKGSKGVPKNTEDYKFCQQMLPFFGIKNLKIIGGCCGVFPSKIALLKKELDSMK